jgi:predicted DCC family thiol-disulfide oxidoreductase YuxK
MTRTEVIHVVYDGQCLFCIRSLRLFQAADVMHVFRFHDAHDEKVIAIKFPQLQGADFDHAMFVVTSRRAVYRGFFAFRRMIWGSPLTWLFIPFFYFPGASFLGNRIYAWVAKNRLRFGCRSDACARPSLASNDHSQDHR